MGQLRFLIRAIDDLNDWQGKILSFCIYPMVLILVYEVFMRYVLNKPTVWAHELSEFFYGAHFIFGGAYALRWRAHVNVEIIYLRFSLRIRAIMDLFTWTLFYLFVGLLMREGMRAAWTAVERMEYSQTVWGPPIWPIKVIIPIAAAMLLLQGFTKTIKDFHTAITGRELVTEVAREVPITGELTL